MRGFVYILAAAMLAAAGQKAWALPVEVQYTGEDPYQVLQVAHPFSAGTYYLVGQSNLELDLLDGSGPVSTVGFCIDLRQTTPTLAESYDLTYLEAAPLDGGSPYSPMGTDKANAIRELWGEHYDEIDGQAAYAAAFQAAVWEIIFENSGQAGELPNAWDVTSGRMVMQSGTAATIANGWLATIGDDSQTLETSLMALTNESTTHTYQDFLVKFDQGGVTPVPEPFTMVTAMLGLCSLGAYVRRRTSS